MDVGQSAMAVLLSICGYFAVKSVNKTDETAKDLDKHKLHVSEHYVKHTSFTDLKQELNDGNKRLHERIDESNQKMDEIKDKMHDGFSEIKTLIIGKK